MLSEFSNQPHFYISLWKPMSATAVGVSCECLVLNKPILNSAVNTNLVIIGLFSANVCWFTCFDKETVAANRVNHGEII